MQTGIYVRVSTEEQAREGFSIRAQQEKLSTYANVMEWDLYKIYADEGISGKNITDRPAINDMISDIKSKKIENVLVFKVDRLTRSTKDLTELLEIFQENNCAFNSLMESIDTKSASGRMFLKIIGIFAEFERENIAERVKLGFEKKAREGYSLSTYCPSYGYNRENGNNVQEINEEEAEIVKEMFDMYLNQDKSFVGIASELNIRKVPSKMGKFWHAKTVQRMLCNPNYIGKVRHCINDDERYFEAEGRHEGFIDEELYNKAQAKMGNNTTKAYTKRPREENYFSGVMECALCGRKLTGCGNVRKNKDGSKNYFAHYVCSGTYVRACNAKSMGHTKVEAAFVEYISKYQDLDVADEVEITNDIPLSANAVLIKEYSEMLTKTEKKEKDVIRLYVDGKLEYEDYTTMIHMIKGDKNAYTKKLAELESMAVNEDIKLTKNHVILSIKENWNLLTKKERLNFLRNNVERIVILNQPQEGTHEGKVKVERIDFFRE